MRKIIFPDTKIAKQSGKSNEKAKILNELDSFRLCFGSFILNLQKNIN